MKTILFSLFLFPVVLMAQSVSIKGLPSEQDTSIQIKKGAHIDNHFQIIENDSEIEGDAFPLVKEARASWKLACSNWKKEMKELQRDNQILALDCGRMECTSVSMEYTCRSKGRHTLKTRIRD